MSTATNNVAGNVKRKVHRSKKKRGKLAGTMVLQIRTRAMIGQDGEQWSEECMWELGYIYFIVILIEHLHAFVDAGCKEKDDQDDKDTVHV